MERVQVTNGITDTQQKHETIFYISKINGLIQVSLMFLTGVDLMLQNFWPFAGIMVAQMICCGFIKVPEIMVLKENFHPWYYCLLGIPYKI